MTLCLRSLRIKDIIHVVYKTIPLFRRPPQVKSSKTQIQSNFYKIPSIRFEDQKLTSFSGLLIVQLLFRRIDLKYRLKNCFWTLMVPFCQQKVTQKEPQLVSINRRKELEATIPCFAQLLRLDSFLIFITVRAMYMILMEPTNSWCNASRKFPGVLAILSLNQGWTPHFSAKT